MSVLTHIVLKNRSLRSEPVATLSLAYILKAEKDIAGAFIGIFSAAGIEFEPANIQTEIGHEDSRPDLTILDDQGYVRAFVENKFWAGLTEAQPVAYLENLPEYLPAALLFIVPQQRVTTVWNELEQRCQHAGLEWENGGNNGNITWSRIGNKILLITSWSHVLERLLNTALDQGHESIRCDILQLRDLTSRMDLEAFLPIRADELTDQEKARRLVNYSDLIVEITQNLEDSGIADTNGLTYAHTLYSHGRYLRMHERFGLWLGIDYEVWRAAGVTPLWWKFHNSDWTGVAGGFQIIRDHFEDEQFYEDGESLYIAIRLEAGVERDSVVREAVAQMTRIANDLLELFPDAH